MFGTIDFVIGDKKADATHTTPEAIEVFRYMKSEETLPEAVIMEVSSHSLALDRVGGLVFDIALFTNLTQDHLDFHDRWFDRVIDNLFGRFIAMCGTWVWYRVTVRNFRQMNSKS